jgi:hypothetical protein
MVRHNQELWKSLGVTNIFSDVAQGTYGKTEGLKG